jgi:hypothetical protein
MKNRVEENYLTKNVTDSWKKEEGENAKHSLLQILNEETGRQRKVYSHEWEQQEMLNGILMRSSKSTRKLFEAIGEMKSLNSHKGEILQVGVADHLFDQKMDFKDGIFGDRLSFRSAPYDIAWTDFQPFDRWGTAAHGPSADIQGHMSLDLTETYVDRPIAYGGWMRNAAGVGSWFKPKSKSTYVRVAPYLPYNYRWKDDSSLQVAHNSGAISVLIQRFISPGKFETVLDNRNQLWSDGTGWYETHDDDQSGIFVNSNYFFASSDEWYLVWIWCNSAIDFATKTTFGSSRANNNMVAGLKWLVFEQWS